MSAITRAGAIGAALFAFGGAPAAWAAGAQASGHGMPWHSPGKISSGVPVILASIAPCPPPPTPGDTVLVGISLSFGTGGVSGQIVPANADGSWSGAVTFNFGGVGIRHTTISANCQDFNGVTGVPYADYMTRHTQIFP